MKSKKWGLWFLALTIGALGCVAGLTALIDPFFHYHAPLKALQYPLDFMNERYLNDGIVRNFDYDAMIAGTSMTENFLASEFDELFGTNTIKVPISGAYYAEVSSLVHRALETHPNIKIILRSLDSYQLFHAPDDMGENRPLYLYDDRFLNDVSYLLNKEILVDQTLEVVRYTRTGGTTTSFDAYAYWFDRHVNNFGKEQMLTNFQPPREKAGKIETFSEEMRMALTDKLTKDMVQIAHQYPNTQFIYYIPPYSILHWENLYYTGALDREIEAYKALSQCLLGIDNIHLYSFYSDFETTTNLDLYQDPDHHNSEVNSQILEKIRNGEFLLTPENCDSHWQEVKDFYSNYDYAALRGE